MSKLEGLACISSNALPNGIELNVTHNVDFIDMNFSTNEAEQCYDYMLYSFSFPSGNKFSFTKYSDTPHCSLGARPDSINVQLEPWKSLAKFRKREDIKIEKKMLKSKERKISLEELKQAIGYLNLLNITVKFEDDYIDSLARRHKVKSTFKNTPPRELKKALVACNQELESLNAH